MESNEPGGQNYDRIDSNSCHNAKRAKLVWLALGLKCGTCDSCSQRMKGRNFCVHDIQPDRKLVNTIATYICIGHL